MVTPAFFASVIASARALFSLGSAHLSAARDISFAWIALTFDLIFAPASFWAWTVGHLHMGEILEIWWGEYKKNKQIGNIMTLLKNAKAATRATFFFVPNGSLQTLCCGNKSFSTPDKRIVGDLLFFGRRFVLFSDSESDNCHKSNDHATDDEGCWHLQYLVCIGFEEVEFILFFINVKDLLLYFL